MYDFLGKKKEMCRTGERINKTVLPPHISISTWEIWHPRKPEHCLDIELGPLTLPAKGFHVPLALAKGRAPVRSLSRKPRNQRAGPSRNWWSYHSLSPNGHLPWLPCTCVFGWPSSVGSTGAHGQRQSFGACGAGKDLSSAPKWFWLPAANKSVYSHGSHWTHGETEAEGSAPALGSWTRWLVRPEGDDRSLPLDTTPALSLHVGYSRRCIMAATLHLG